MAVNLSPVGGVAAQFFTNTGAVLTGGKLYTYAAGTTTPVVTYTSSQGNVAWTNPIVLDAAGRVSGSGEIWLTDGVIYKFVLKDSNDVLIATYDNITGINSNAVAYTNQQEIVTATANQTVFDLMITYAPGTNSLSVFVDGVNQYGPGAQYSYVETDSNTVTFNSGLHVGAEVKFTTTQQQGAGAVDASQVTYDPPFTGSAVTNVEAKLAQTINVKDFGAVGDGSTDDTAAINAAIDAAYNAGGGVVTFLPKTYAILTTVKIRSNVTLDLCGATLQRIGTNKTMNIVQNYTYNPATATDSYIGIINGIVAGNVTNDVATQDHTAAAGNIFFYGVSIFRIENIRIVDANSNGFGWREATNGIVNHVTGGTFGGNLFAPTSGLNNYVTNCDFAYAGATGASPGVCVDIESNSVSEVTGIYFSNCRINDLVMVDFWQSAGGTFIIEAQFDNCTFVGGSPYTVKIIAANNVNARNVVFGDTCRIGVLVSTASAIQLGSVNGIVCNAQLGNDSGSAGTTRGIETSAAVSNLTFGGSTAAGATAFANDIDSSNYTISSSHFRNVKFGSVYLQGSDNYFDGGSISSLTIKGSSSTNNIFGASCPVGSITLASSATLTDQDFGSDRGARAKSWYSQSATVADSSPGTTYDMVVPLPSAAVGANGRLLFIAAGYSHRGDSGHWAQYLGTVRIGDSAQAEANSISSTGAAGVSIAVQAVTTTSVTLRLTYTYVGIFSATVLG